MNGSIEACLVQSIVYISNLLKTSITAGSLFDLLRMAISPQTKASRHQIKVLRIHEDCQDEVAKSETTCQWTRTYRQSIRVQ